ncbi:hypothetical protein KM043_006334 [Ampulex compressa]|nr:hypothetical protein KM043_006334 [Ampulex compressa]
MEERVDLRKKDCRAYRRVRLNPANKSRLWYSIEARDGSPLLSVAALPFLQRARKVAAAGAEMGFEVLISRKSVLFALLGSFFSPEEGPRNDPPRRPRWFLTAPDGPFDSPLHPRPFVSAICFDGPTHEARLYSPFFPSILSLPPYTASDPEDQLFTGRSTAMAADRCLE